MIYEYATKDGKRPAEDDCPTRVSVGGREYEVKDFCVDAPGKFEFDMAQHGFKVRQRERVTVRDEGPPAAPPPQAGRPTSAQRQADK